MKPITHEDLYLVLLTLPQPDTKGVHRYLHGAIKYFDLERVLECLHAETAVDYVEIEGEYQLILTERGRAMLRSYDEEEKRF